MKKHRKQVRIQWGDCDPAEIVFYPEYFRWFDESTAELFDAVGLNPQDLFRRYGVIGIPILEAKSSFRGPSRFWDLITVESQVAHWGNSSFRVEHAIYNHGACIIEGYEVRAWVAKKPGGDGGLQAVPVPHEVRARFA